MSLDASSCYRALAARDRRFDGLFFVAVETTGIYCRPVCPARTPRRDRCAFFRTAAEADHAGFRACFRCRPELAPGGAPVDALPRLVARAVARIDEGALNDHGVEHLAGELGVTGRHLRRAMERELGVSPVALALSRRLALAKQLLHDTALGYADVAFASGFGSVRRFNAAFRERFDCAPGRVRRQHGRTGPRAILLRLEYRPPLDWSHLYSFLGHRAIPGVERVAEGEYHRVVRLDGAIGTVRVRPASSGTALEAHVSLGLAGHLLPCVAGLRRLFDLDARPDVVARALGRDRLLAPLVRRRPGLRLPGCVDPFEAAARALLGQQISVRAATTLAGRLVTRFGTELPAGSSEPGEARAAKPTKGASSPRSEARRAEPTRGASLPRAARSGNQAPACGGPIAGHALTHAFPSPSRIAAASVGALASIGLPRQRAEALQALARAVANGTLELSGRDGDPERFLRDATALPGIGDWTAQYLRMRALHDPDAFPAGDLGVRKALRGMPPGRAARRAEAWRPWRSYAVVHLWTSLSETDP